MLYITSSSNNDLFLDGTYFYSEPNRYIFPGAEVYKDSNSKDSNDYSDDDSGTYLSNGCKRNINKMT